MLLYYINNFKKEYKKMKNLLLTFSLILLGAAAFSQPKVQFLTKVHDFGIFKEEAGPQTFNFIVTNMGDSALFIKNVVPSCGCTTPGWTQSPIPPKGQGKITATYDPAGRPDKFEKSLTVYTNAKPEMEVLIIKGEVQAKVKTVEELFPFAVGPVRFENNQIAFLSTKKNEKKIRVMPVINTSATPAKIEFENVPQHLILKVVPETLKPGQKGLVEATYDATKNPGWGNVTDMTKIKVNGIAQKYIVNGVPQNDIWLYITADLVEDFSGLSKEDLLNAPVFKVAATTVDIGTMQTGASRDVEFKYRNEGKRDLNIRYIRPSCGCTAVQQGSMVIKPGQESSIKATFSSAGYGPGKQTKSIYVFTDDPKNSEVVLFLNAEIVAKPAEK
jgi:hypothetical protein